jgi:putative transposase
MLNLSRWSDKGGSYRTIQRFYNASICWLNLNIQFFLCHQFCKDEVYLLGGDETTVSKSGKSTHGLGRFFSSIHSRSIPGLCFFSLSLIAVNRHNSSPILMEQLDPKMRKYVRPPKQVKTKNGKPGRPKGSKNKTGEKREITEYLKWIKGNIQRALGAISGRISIAYFVYDGAFGNHECLSMVKSCGLRLISKLQCNSALWYRFEGEYSGKGPRKKYGQKVNYEKLPKRYLKKSSTKGDIEERIYQMSVWHRAFSDQLNVVIIQRIKKKDGKWGQIILFSDDLELLWESMILYYRLRFQVEFNYRDAKQFWGLEDFMNTKQTPVQNAANFSMFMVNVSQVISDNMQSQQHKSVLDLKARFQASFYLGKLLKIDPQIAKVISFKQVQRELSDIGCIHQLEKAA